MSDRTARRSPKRANGEGSIYPTEDGRWRGALVITNPLTGEERRRYVRGRTRAEVVRRMDAIRQDATVGNLATATTGEYLAAWVESVRPRLRPATHRNYAQHARDYWAPLASIPLARLAPGDVERVMAGMTRRGLSSQTVAHARSTLRRALKDAQRDGLIARNAASLARPPRLERRELHPLTASQVRDLLAATAEDSYGPLFALAVSTGLRQGEVLGLRWRDVDVAARSLVVRRALTRTADGGFGLGEPKTSRSRRTVMLSAAAVSALRRRAAAQEVEREAAGADWRNPDDLVFTTPLGDALRPWAVSTAFRAAATDLGFAVRFHDLRHTAATLLLSAGVPLKVVSETLGHSSIAITADVYAHLTPELRREAADAMDRALGG